MLIIDAYYGTINNKLVAFPTLYVWKMTNFGRVNTKGFELSASLNTLLTKHICWQTNVGYTFQSLLDKTEKALLCMKTTALHTQTPFHRHNHYANINGAI